MFICCGQRKIHGCTCRNGAKIAQNQPNENIENCRKTCTSVPKAETEIT